MPQDNMLPHFRVVNVHQKNPDTVHKFEIYNRLTSKTMALESIPAVTSKF
jgi:hypothetical protein